VGRLTYNQSDRQSATETGYYLTGIVGTPVVNNNDFKRNRRGIKTQRSETGTGVTGLIVYRDDNGKFRH